MQVGRILTAAVIGGAVSLSSCSSGDDEAPEKAACFYECPSGTKACFFIPGIDEGQCESAAQDDCGGPPTNLDLERGCSCPGFDEPGECTPPPWAS